MNNVSLLFYIADKSSRSSKENNMKLHTFTDIGGFPWLNISLLAYDTAEAVKKFNTIWGTNVRYKVTTGPVGFATQILM